MPKYPDVKITLVGEDGNAFAILGRVSKALRKAHGSEISKKFTEEATKGDYYHLLRTAMEWVEVE